MRLLAVSLVTAVLFADVAARSGTADENESAAALGDDEQVLLEAGLTSDGMTLLHYFRNRARTEADPARLDDFVRRFTGPSAEDRLRATSELVALGPLAIPVLRRVANDLEDPEATVRARHALKWLEGARSATLSAAAARLMAQRKPAGAAEALLGYLPFADDETVAREVTSAIAATAVSAGKVEPILVQALSDPLPVRRAAAAVALAQAAPEEQRPAVRRLLDDPNPLVRMRTALALAEARDPAAIPVLIDLLGVLTADKRRQVEEVLQELAGEWAPVTSPIGEDEIARRIRRDAWSAWWKNTDGPALLGMLRKRTLSPTDQERIRALIRRLGDASFEARERASNELVAQGPMILPLLREALKAGDLEVVRRAEKCIYRIQTDPALHLPAAAVRLLALRRPAGALEALLAYLPFAEDEILATEVQTALGGLAEKDTMPDPVLVRALGESSPVIRGAAAEALARNSEARPAVRKLLEDTDLSVRLRVGLALAAREREAIPTLIDLIPNVTGDQVWQIQDFLTRLAGDQGPLPPAENDPPARKKSRDAWAQWWKDHGAKIDLARLDNSRQFLGFTLVIASGNGNNGRVVELGRDNKPRWSIENVHFPVDAWVLPGNRVLIAEYNGNSVTERDLKGKILWQKQGFNGSPVNVQRLPNGNTFIATLNMILEVDRNGKQIYTINSLGAITAAYKTRNGHILCLTQGGQCVRLTADGKQLKSFPSNRTAGWTSGIDVLDNGRILITQPNRNKVAEYDPSGKLILEVDAPQVTTATGLPNGHILAASNNTRRVFEIDRRGKVVWEYQEPIPVFRARRR